MREYELEVLEQYDIEVRSTRKIRGAFFCEAKEGTMLLKEADVSDRRAPLLYAVLRGLEENGYSNVDTPLFNKEGSLISVTRDGSRYMLKRWFAGKECEVKKEHEILQAVKNLAQLHLMLNWERLKTDIAQEHEESISHSVARSLTDELVRHNRELKKVREFMRNKVSKGSFEFLYLDCFEKMYGIAKQVVKQLETSGYSSLYRESLEKGTLIHGDYNYHNVLFTQKGIATTNFEHLRIDIQAQDLYYFLRKVMEKHQWNEALGRAMLETYQTIRPLENRELEFMALSLAYPEKFWKTANSYYHSNKAWIPEKNVEKLQMAIAQTEEKLRFIENIFTFHL